MNIAGKVIAITGASSGIGRAAAIHMAQRGARVVLGARREHAISEVAAEIRAAGGEATWRVTDVAHLGDLEALVAIACERFGQLDVLVNNAGTGPLSRFDAVRVADWDEMIDVNLRGVLYGIAAALPIFARQQSGHIINVVSTAGLKILPMMAVYGATKNAVRTLSEGLRQEAGPNLRVTEISPGAIATEFSNRVEDESARRTLQAQLRAIAIAPEAVARAIAFAVEQPPDVEIGSIVVRPTAQN
jgi:NADP-dependent 3-hydroxy acid dehydrogenase YdfG